MRANTVLIILVVVMLFALGHTSWHAGLNSAMNGITDFFTGTPLGRR